MVYITAFKWYQQGKLPVTFEVTPTGRIHVFPVEVKRPQKIVTYSRVSSQDQRKDLIRQTHRLRDFCTSKGKKRSLKKFKRLVQVLTEDVLN